ncbi:hypothetical protein CTM97_16060 [Photobacterium phosphoreum]|uniref:Uncharacterized protein n=1 Tax=Photobacterium phosphoreum TaxID=659 RepID=A0A2T3JTB5_PHOPO|nr:hypothetical protein [Photobacterium phosphoreum]PSU21219.1 hypothetical protein CTM96_18125 [Photobacterium phosphoreum]PSU40183.1 hypothetical protein CTM97_16060 [Photobacterium phosphoreum]PSU52387.1 hypothetical protein C9J18_09595 [Photobacterium phosphoreum]
MPLSNTTPKFVLITLVYDDNESFSSSDTFALSNHTRLTQAEIEFEIEPLFRFATYDYGKYPKSSFIPNKYGLPTLSQVEFDILEDDRDNPYHAISNVNFTNETIAPIGNDISVVLDAYKQGGIKEYHEKYVTCVNDLRYECKHRLAMLDKLAQNIQNDLQ